MTPELEHLKILVADDSPDNRYLIVQMLRLAGASVDVAGDGAEAVALARVGNFDAVLLDIQMPVMDGYGALRGLRDMGFNGPILALTAHAFLEERERCLASGFDEHIAKPIDRKAMTAMVARLVRHRADRPWDRGARDANRDHVAEKKAAEIPEPTSSV